MVDNIRPLDYEIYAVNKIYGSQDGQHDDQTFRPFWHTWSGDSGNYGAYFSLRREQRVLSEHALHYGTRTGYIGSEVFASLVDAQHAPWQDTLRYISAEVLCTSRDLPLMLQQELGQFIVADSMPVKSLTLRKGPTSPIPALAEGFSTWRLISQLQMNYLSLMDGENEEGAAALRQLLGLYANLAAARQRGENGLHEIAILSFGLFGPNGPLPLHITEYARERLQHHQDASLSAFADLFHHRLTLLFYHAWADAQPAISLDRSDNNRFEGYLASLIGMGQPGQMKKGSLSSHARFTWTGHLSRHGRDPQGLEKILSGYFNIPVKLVANVPQWMPLTRDEQAQLGQGRRLPRLGESAFLGIAVRDVQHKFRLDMGPLSAEAYDRFLPGEASVTALRDWVRQYAGIDFE